MTTETSTDLTTLTDVEVLELWSNIIRDKNPDRVRELLRAEKEPVEISEREIVEVGREMTERELTESMCLI